MTVSKVSSVVVLCCPPQNVKLGLFTSWSCSDGKEMYKKALLFCQSKPTAFLPFLLMSPSSLLKLPIYYGMNPTLNIFMHNNRILICLFAAL